MDWLFWIVFASGFYMIALSFVVSHGEFLGRVIYKFLPFILGLAILYFCVSELAMYS